MEDIILLRHPAGDFPHSNVSSLAEEYFSIPEDLSSLSKKRFNKKDLGRIFFRESSNIRVIEAGNIVRKKRGIDDASNSEKTSTANKGDR